jgi:hypothetical protein
MNFRLQAQLKEALGADNRWYCSQKCCQSIDDAEALMRHFVKNGGAVDFARRFADAMGHLNRWYCSQFHGFEVQDEETLWNYYMEYRAAKSNGQTSNSFESCSASKFSREHDSIPTADREKFTHR